MSDDLLTRVREDQRRRWEAGEPALVEAYLAAHPELAGDDEAVLDLIYSEVLLREELGERAGEDEYVRRFPTYAAAIVRQFAVHELIRAGSSGAGETLTDEFTPADGRAAAPDLPGYRLGRVLGEGSWGVVYEATHLALARRVAVKVARGAGETVLREAAAAVRIDSPHVVRVYDAGAHGGRAYLAMELVSGCTLTARLGQPLPPADAAALLLGVARGVAAAHAAGIVHRDLKPANVLLAPDGVPKVTDFGLARVGDAAGSLVQSGATVGSEGYMAPEQAGGAKGVGPTADVWALGVILHELLAGERPFRGDGLVETVTKARFDPTPRVRGLPAGLDAVRCKCLEKRPADRYPSAAELAADLSRWLGGGATAARLPSLARRTWRAIQPRRIIPNRVEP